MLTRPQPYEAEAVTYETVTHEAETHEAEAKTHEAEAKILRLTFEQLKDFWWFISKNLKARIKHSQ